MATEQQQSRHSTSTASTVLDKAEYGGKVSGEGQGAADEPSSSPPPKDSSPSSSAAAQFKFILLMSASCLSAFLVGLDQTIITTAIQQITAEFDTPEDVGWYGSAYLLTSCAFQPIYGQMYRRFDTRRIYFVVLAIFLVGSIVCAAAPSSKALIVGRALAGLGCAGVLAGNLNIVASSVSLDRRAVYVSMLGTLFGIALVCGPIIGGALTARATWRWCFWINLPIGVVATAAIFAFFRPEKSDPPTDSVWKRLRTLDFPGSVLIITSAIMLLLALQWGGTTYAWGDSRIIGLLVGAGVEAIVFVLWQYYKQKEALVPLYILTNRSVAATILASFFQSGATFLPIFYLPYWFQVVKGTTSLIAGVDMIPWMVGNFLAALVASIIVSKTGYLNPPAIIGPAVGAIGQGLFVTLTQSTSVGKWVGYQILNSVGLGAARQQYFLAVQAVLSAGDIPIAMSFVLFCQNLGGAVFLSVANALIRNSLSTSLETYQFANVSSSQILSAAPTDLRSMVEASQLDVLTRFYNKALVSVWIMGIPLVILSMIFALPIKWVNLRAGRKKNDKRETPSEADLEKA